MSVIYMTVIIRASGRAVIIACVVAVDSRVVITSVVTAIVVVGAVVVVMVSPPRVSVVGFAPDRIVVRMTPSKAPIGAVIRISEAPVPVVVPRVGNHYVVVSSATVGTVKTVDTSCV